MGTDFCGGLVEWDNDDGILGGTVQGIADGKEGI